MKDASLPSARSAGWRSRVSPVLSRRYDFLPALPPHFVAFAWRYHAVPLGFAPAAQEATAAGQECFCFGHSEAEIMPVETTGSPKFLGNPNCFCAMFFDSGRTARPFAISVVYSMAPVKGTTRAPAT